MIGLHSLVGTAKLSPCYLCIKATYEVQDIISETAFNKMRDFISDFKNNEIIYIKILITMCQLAAINICKMQLIILSLPIYEMFARGK